MRLKEIEDYIAKDNETKAINFIDKLISAGESILDNHEKGRVVPELSISRIREIIYKNYSIVYIIKPKSIEILTIFECYRLLKKEEIRYSLLIPYICNITFRSINLRKNFNPLSK